MATKKYLRRFTPEQSINGGDLGTTVTFNVTNGKNDYMYWSKGQSFLVIKSTHTRSGGSLINNTNPTRRTWNWPAALFTTVREKMNGATYGVVNNFTQADSILKRQRYSNDYYQTVGSLMGLNSDADRLVESQAFKTMETIFIPSALSTFQIDELQPSSAVRLEFDIDRTSYRNSCIESTTVGTPRTLGTDYVFEINSIELYVMVAEGAADLMVERSFPYNLVEYKTLVKAIDSPSITENIKVEPSLVSVMYGLQHLNSQSSNAYSATKFQPVTTGAGTPNAYSVLNKQYLKYNGVNYPEGLSTFVNNADEVSGYKLSTYMNLIYNGLLWNGSGYEGYNLFSDAYGRYFVYDVEKDASVQATDATINMDFNQSVDCRLVVTTSNTFVLSVAYDKFGNISGTPIKDVK